MAVWFKGYNQGRPYNEQVKPFGFLNALQMAFFASLSQTKRQPLRPIALFEKDPRVSAKRAFDRLTGVSIPTDALKSYGAALARFPLSPEAKFANGKPFDIGRTERRQVRVSGIVHIGKEANKWEEQFFLGVEEAEQIEYGAAKRSDQNDRLRDLCAKVGERAAALLLGVSRMTLRKARRIGKEKMSTQIKYRLDRI